MMARIMVNLTYKKGIIRDAEGWGVRTSTTSLKLISIPSRLFKQIPSFIIVASKKIPMLQKSTCHNSYSHRLYSKFLTCPRNNHNEEEKHVVHNKISKIIHTHTEERGKLVFFSNFFNFFFNFFPK